MESNKSLLLVDRVDITDKLYLRIPTVGEILEDEHSYYNFITSITASPMQFMVQLDDMGVDFTTINDYELFLMLFPVYAQGDLSIVFGDVDLSDASVQSMDGNVYYIYCQKSGVIIDIPTYTKLTDTIRKINLLEKDKSHPGNESAKRYLLEKERRRLKRLAKKPHAPYLENLVIALVNTSEFPYNYETCMDLSIYQFNQSLKQIQQKITFDNTMIGVYSGTVDTRKMGDKRPLSWISTDN